jgi:hypothetical protein
VLVSVTSSEGFWLPKKDRTQRRPGWADNFLGSFGLVSSLGPVMRLLGRLDARVLRGMKKKEQFFFQIVHYLIFIQASSLFGPWNANNNFYLKLMF